MAKQERRHPRPKRTNDKQIAGVDRIDASPEDIARALFKRPPPKARRTGDAKG